MRQKRLRETRKTTKKRQIVVKRIIGDFKYAKTKEINFTTPFGKSMLVYNFLLNKIGQGFKKNQLTYVRFPGGRERRVFLISQNVAKPIAFDKAQTVLEFLREDGEQIFVPIHINSENVELAKNILADVLKFSKSQKFKI